MRVTANTANRRSTIDHTSALLIGDSLLGTNDEQVDPPTSGFGKQLEDVSGHFAIQNEGRAGAKSGEWLDGDPADFWSLVELWMPRDLVFVSLGGNDVLAGTTPATFQANLTTLFADLVTAGARYVGWITPLPSTFGLETETDAIIVGGEAAVALSTKYEKAIDFNNDFTWANDMGDGVNALLVHLNNRGHQRAYGMALNRIKSLS